MRISFDIAIRTTGRGGEKYRLLLNSIQNLTDRPNNIYVILPDGAAPPKEQIGAEKFIYATKGMMTQRIAALECCQSEYILFCDDDLKFGEDFVRKLYESIISKKYKIATGELLELLPPEGKLKTCISAIGLAAVPKRDSSYYVKILPSAGWTYHRFIPEKGKVLPTQSAAGALFFCSRETFFELKFSDELWAQHDFMAPADDQIMFYKAYLIGLTPCVVTDAHFDHLSSQNSITSPGAKKQKNYWSGFNRTVFWYRFIWQRRQGPFQKIIALEAFTWFICIGLIHTMLSIFLSPLNKWDRILFYSGVFKAILFIMSKGCPQPF